MRFSKDQKGKVEIYGHRGSAGTYPENTLISFAAAERAGADGIECDVHLTKDGEIVVIHDETVNRTTDGKGRVKDFTLRELKQLDAGSFFSRQFAGEKIPTLREVLDWLKGTELKLNIELKTGVIYEDQLVEKVVKEVRAFGLADRVIFSSFHHDTIRKLHRLAPETDCAILFMEGLYRPWDYARKIGASALHCYWKAALPEMIEGATRAGIAVRPFTVNLEEKIVTFVRLGCTGIITDFPEKAVFLRRKLQEN